MLNETEFRSADVPAADRLAYWAERVGQTHAPVRMTSDHAHDFRATQRVLDLGAVSVWPATFQQLIIRRTPKLIRRSDPELYHLSLLVGGTGTGTWDREEAVYRPSDLHINDSSVPWEIRTGKDPVTAVGLELPKALVPLPRGAHGRSLPKRVPAGTGIGVLLAQFLSQLIADTACYRPSDGPRLGGVVTDLVTAVFAHALEAENSLPRTRTGAPSCCVSRSSSRSTCTTRSSPPRASLPRTTSPPAICTGCSRTRRPRSPPGSAAGAWRRPVATSSIRR
nr:AraC family transcriptional regulator [Streptomyces sp. NBC_01445]